MLLKVAVIAGLASTEALKLRNEMQQSAGLGRTPSHELPQKFHDAYRKDEQRSSATCHLKGDCWEDFFNGDKNDFQFTDSHGSQKSFSGQGSKDVKLVIGIMAQTNQPDIHHAHLDTWMQQDGACSVDQFQDRDCHVFPMLIFGNISSGAPEYSKNAVVLTDIAEPEDVVSGYTNDNPKKMGNWKTRSMLYSSRMKTPSWINYAQKHFPWATHVAKMDLDCYPHIPIILHDLEQAPQQALFYGRFFGKHGFAKHGGMFGEFYLVTSDLLNCWSDQNRMLNKKHGKNARVFPGHPEDQAFSTVLFRAEEAKICPAVTQMHVQNRWQHPM